MHNDMRVSIIITGEEMEVDKVIQENSIRKELFLISKNSHLYLRF